MLANVADVFIAMCGKTRSMLMGFIFPLVPLLFSVIACSRIEQPRAREGILDLSRYEGIAVLSGKWEIHWERLLEPKDFRDADITPTGYITVPGSWNGFRVGTKTVDPYSFATYRLKIHTGNSDRQRYAIYFPEIVNPVRIWINGINIKGSSLEEFEQEKKHRRDYTPFIYSFESTSPFVEILIQMHNTNHLRGGLRSSIHFGKEERVRKYHARNLHLEIFLAGILLIMSLYHVALFLLRKNDLSNLFFSILCFFVFARTSVTGENFLLVHFPEFPLVPQLKLEALTYYLGVGAAFLFIVSLFKEYASKKVSVVIVSFILFFSMIVLVASPMVYPHTLIPFQIITIAIGLYCFSILFRAFKERKVEVTMILVAWSVQFLCVLNDILYTDNITDFTGYVMPAGMVFFVFTHSFVISRRFSLAFKETRKLSRELEKSNILLEEKVEERTAELLKKNFILEKKKEIEEKDMEIAVHLQMSMMPPAPTGIPGWDIALEIRPMAGVSGDFYDFYVIDGELKGAGIFDVSGHGISSGLITLLGKWLIFRAYSKNIKNPLSDVFHVLSITIPQAIGNTSYFLTGILLRFEGNTVEYANAGHADLLHISNGKAELVRNADGSAVKGSLLGFDSIRSDYEVLRFSITQGDFLVMYTDGIIEAQNKSGEQFGMDRLIASCENAKFSSARDFLNSVISDLDMFREDVSLTDDCTIVVMKRV